MYPAVFHAIAAAFFVLVVFQLVVVPTSAHGSVNGLQSHTHDDNAIVAAESTCENEPEPVEWPHKVNMDAIFPPGEGRDLVLWNCMNCHTFVRIVAGHNSHSHSADAGSHSHDHSAEGPVYDTHWDTHRIFHRARLWRLSDQELDVLYAYLKANFNDTKPEPQLPCWLRESYW